MKKNMKKIIMATMLVGTLSSVPVMAQNNIKVTVNGNAVSFTDQEPVIVEGATYIPIRGILEQFNYSVKWYEQPGHAGIFKRGKATAGSINVFYLYPNRNSVNIIYWNSDVSETLDKKVAISNPVRIINGRTMIPLRDIGTIIGANITWDDTTKTAGINEEGYVEKKVELVETPTETKPESTTEPVSGTSSEKTTTENETVSATEKYLNEYFAILNNRKTTIGSLSHKYSLQHYSNLWGTGKEETYFAEYKDINESDIAALKALSVPESGKELNKLSIEYLEKVTNVMKKVLFDRAEFSREECDDKYIYEAALNLCKSEDIDFTQYGLSEIEGKSYVDSIIWWY